LTKYTQETSGTQQQRVPLDKQETDRVARWYNHTIIDGVDIKEYIVPFNELCIFEFVLVARFQGSMLWTPVSAILANFRRFSPIFGDFRQYSAIFVETNVVISFGNNKYKYL
jgi:hypothetical protein